ncbi:MAG: NifU family protein [Flavobacteriales bacterium]|nr:NifU family protein [Flavobacteriales bacterium]
MEKTIAPYTFYAEMTPNPNTMKFVANRWLITNGNQYEFLTTDYKNCPSPLAKSLFGFPFVTGVFISANYVTVAKIEAIDWQDILIELRDFISNFMNKDGAVIIDESFLSASAETKKPTEKTISENTNPNREYSEIEQQLISILDEYIKPAVESDGGAIVFDSYSEGTVKVILKGSCSGCPSSTITLKMGIENLMKNMMPEVKEVIAING